MVPVFTKGDKNSVENYMPISLTSLVMEVFERCVRTSLLTVGNDLLDPRQHGFLADRSCVTQMISFTEDISMHVTQRKI